MHLISVSFSHFCEKARWALDRFAVPYTERRVLPLLHFPFVGWATLGQPGRSDPASTRFSTPTLCMDDGTVLQDSARIVRWVSDTYGAGSLHPDPAIDDLESRLHDGVGVWTRWLIYRYALDRPEVVRWMATHTVGRTQSTLFRALRPVASAALKRALRIDPSRTERIVARTFAALDGFEAGAHGRYLVGDTFTAADLAFACMVAPLVLPPQYGVPLPPVEILPPEHRALVARAQAHPAGQRALRLFAEERLSVKGGATTAPGRAS